MSPKTITIIGSLNMDLVTLTPYVPKGGETMTAHSFYTGPGGKGANQAVACARLSRPKPNSSSSPPKSAAITVKMLGAVGDDEFGPRLLSGLSDSGVDVSGILTVPESSTGVAVILVESDSGENRILLSPGANHTLLPSSFPSSSSLGSPLPDMIILQLEIPLETVLHILETAKAASIPTLLNPAPAVTLPASIYPSITHLILNETEAALLSTPPLPLDAISSPSFDWSGVTSSFLAQGVQSVVVTLGAKGAFWATGRESGFVPAAEVRRVVDTTAAGDTFVGAYAVAVVAGQDGQGKGAGWLGDVVRTACKAAGKTVEKKGAQDAIPWADEVDA